MSRKDIISLCIVVTAVSMAVTVPLVANDPAPTTANVKKSVEAFTTASDPSAVTPVVEPPAAPIAEIDQKVRDQGPTASERRAKAARDARARRARAARSRRYQSNLRKVRARARARKAAAAARARAPVAQPPAVVVPRPVVPPPPVVVPRRITPPPPPPPPPPPASTPFDDSG